MFSLIFFFFVSDRDVSGPGVSFYFFFFSSLLNKRALVVSKIVK